METLYTAVVTSNGGRSGNVKSQDGVLDLMIRPPKEMGGPGGTNTNPEQLFAAAYSACFGGALSHVALEKNIRVRPEIVAKVSFLKTSDGFRIAAELNVNVPGVELKQAKELAMEAHNFCPYSKAIRNNVEVTIKVTNNK